MRVPFPDDFQEAQAALLHIVRHDVDAVDAAHGLHRLAVNLFVVHVAPIALGVVLPNDVQLTPQDFHEEVSRAARRFKETGVYPLRLLLHEVQHGIYFACRREHLAALCHALL